MFEALFILTAVDAGTRVGRFMLQDTIGNVWPKYADLSWKPASWSASAIVVGLWGYMLYVGVTDPLGGINQLFPLFGIANQLLAAIALTLCVTLLIKHGKAKWAWVPGIGLVWDLIATMTASYQKVFSDNPKIGYFEQRSVYQAAIDNGEVLAPATDMDQMQTIVTNSTVNGTLQSIFALLVIIIVANALVIWVKAIRAGGLPTTEVPAVPSEIVAPSDFFATAEEKEAVQASGRPPTARSARWAADTMRAAVLRAGRGAAWFVRQATGEAKWDEYLSLCREQGAEPMSPPGVRAPPRRPPRGAPPVPLLLSLLTTAAATPWGQFAPDQGRPGGAQAAPASNCPHGRVSEPVETGIRRVRGWAESRHGPR